VRQIKLIYVGFRAHVKIAYRIVSYRIHLIRLDYSASDSEAEEYCDDRVCLCVCEFVSPRAGTTRLIFTKIFVHVTYGSGSSSGGVVICWVLPVL